MRFENGNIVDMFAHAEGKQLAVFGNHADLRELCIIFSSYNLWERIDVITDIVADSGSYSYNGKEKPLIAFGTFCKSLSADSQCVILFANTSLFITCELTHYTIPKDTVFYIGEFLKHAPPPYNLYQYMSDTQLIPKIIHYCWFGGNAMKPIHHKCLESWRKFCPDYEIVEWNENNFDVHQNQYISEAYQSKKWAFVSDYTRLDVLYRFGGIYLDTDVELLRPIDDFLYETGFCGSDFPGITATGVIGAAQNHETIRKLRDAYAAEKFIKPDGSFDMTANTMRLTNFLMQHGFIVENKPQRICDITIYPTDVFSPTHVSHWYEYFSDKTYAVHYFDWSWGDAEKIRDKLSKVKAFREGMSTFSETPIYHFPVPPLPDSPVQNIPPEMWQAFPEAANLLYYEHYDEALDVLEQYLAMALEVGSISDAEYVLAIQLFVAAIWGNEPLMIDIRTMRLELFVKSGQGEKAEKEFSALQTRCNPEQLQSIKELTGFE